MRYLSVCAIVRDEALYIDEWIKFHNKLGIEHFYIYDHYSKDRTVDKALALGPNLVTVRKITNEAYVSAQCGAYTECLKEFRNNTRWLGFIDIDEFITPLVTQDIASIMQNYEEAPALGIHWRLFGSNGELDYKDAPVVERFIRREVGVNRHLKCFVNPQRTERYLTPHKFHHVNAFAVDELLRPIGTYDSIPLNGTAEIIQCNHYATKSKAECILRRSRPRADTGRSHGADFFVIHDRNDIEDTRARDLWRAS